jgi:hypothetical protein
MNRRSFLGLSSAALAAFTLDPERALWVPGQRSYFDIVAPKVHRYSEIMIETLDGVVATMRLSHDFPVELGQAIDCSLSDGLPGLFPRLFSGRVIGIRNALRPNDTMVLKPSGLRPFVGAVGDVDALDYRRSLIGISEIADWPSMPTFPARP